MRGTRPQALVVGDRLPAFTVPLTLQRLVMEAAVNRDFSPMHHDRDGARATGAPDVYANTFFFQSYLEVTLRRWMGPAGRLMMLDFRMNTFSCVGDVLACSGEVTAVRSLEDREEADLAVWVESHRRRTVSGSATVSIPRGSGVG